MLIGYKEKFAKFLQDKKDVNQAVIEYVNGLEVIKTFNQTANAYEKYVNAVYNNAACGYYSMKSSQIFMSLAITVMEGVMILILPFGWTYYTQGTIDAETLLTFIFLSLGIMRPLIDATFVLHEHIFPVAVISVPATTFVLFLSSLRQRNNTLFPFSSKPLIRTFSIIPQTPIGQIRPKLSFYLVSHEVQTFVCQHLSVCFITRIYFL